MSPELTEALFRDFPQLYRGRHRPLSESSMSLGFECGDGWYSILHDLSQRLTDHLHRALLKELEVMQVKSKFGSLMYYVSGGDRRVERLIKVARFQTRDVIECGDEPPYRFLGTGYVFCEHVRITPGVAALLKVHHVPYFKFLSRHFNGDWGRIEAVGKAANTEALKTGARICSEYELGEQQILVITEACGEDGIRAFTHMLLPSEYPALQASGVPDQQSNDSV